MFQSTLGKLHTRLQSSHLVRAIGKNNNIIHLPSRYIKETFGKVHSVDTFTAIDGPGIRYMLFLQGCNLRCKSCSNPDTWDHKCGTEMSSKDVIKNIAKYRNYIDGITVSGGEPLLQPQFVSTLFEECHELNLNTCIDTAGQSLTKNWHMVLPHTDLALICIKHIDPIKYYKFTGMPQKHALQFMDTVQDYNVPFYLRYLYIPGYSDDYNDIDKFIEYAKTLKGLKAIEFLPYHRLGVNKWESIGLKYSLADVQVPEHDKVDEVRKYFEDAGLFVL
jgi:pyruvate formate lyase activating enzyme